MQRLIDSASSCRPMVEARVETVADVRQRADQWNLADGGLSGNLEVLADGGVRLKASAGAAVGPTVQNSWFRSKEPGNNTVGTAFLDPIHNSYTDRAAGVLGQWFGTAANVSYGSVQAWLNPRFSASQNKFVQTWELIIYGLSATRLPGNTKGLKYTQVAIAQTKAPSEAAGWVQFNFTDANGKYVPWHPDAAAGAPPLWNFANPQPIDGAAYFIVCHGYDSKGNPCTNIAWGMDNTTTTFSSGAGNNVINLFGRMLGTNTPDDVSDFAVPSPSGIPALQFIPVTYAATATVTFQTGSPIDLGNAPSAASLVEFGVRAEQPLGTSIVAQAALDPGASYVTFTDGQSAADIGLAAQRKYDMRVTLNASAGQDRTPIVRLLGARVVAKTDLGDLADVVSWSERTDPILHKSEIEEVTIRVLHDGERDYKDQITQLLSQNPPGQFYFRVSIGDRALPKSQWLHLNDFYPDDVQLEDAYTDLVCVSCLSQLKQALPVLSPDQVAAPTADSSNPGAWTASIGSLLYPQIADTAEPPWAAATAYLVGQRVIDANSNVQVCTVAGTSGGSAPSWAATINSFTTDNTITWQNQGAVSSGFPDDTTYIQSPNNPANADYVATLNPIGTPQQSVGATIQVRAATVGAAQSLSLVMQLREGATIRATRTFTVTNQDLGQGSYQVFQSTLTPTEQGAIVSWSNLNYLIRANGTGGIRVGWCRLVVLGRRAPYVSSGIGASIQPIMDDLINNQIALDGRFRGPKYTDPSPALSVSKTIEQAAGGSTDLNRAMDELEALAWIGGGFFAGDEGKVVYRPFYNVSTGNDLVTGTTTALYTPLVGPIREIFPMAEIEPISVTPGWRQRIPVFSVPWGWNGQNFAGESVVINQPALTFYRQAMIEAELRCPTETAKWVSGDGLARGLSARHGQSFGLGLMEWRFRSTYPKPWLQRGDVVAIQTDRFIGYDPIATRAIAGKQWVTGVIIGRWDAMGREWSVWIQSLSAIRPIAGALAIPPFSATNPLSLGVSGYIGEAPGTSAGDDLNVFWAGTPAVAAVKIATSTSAPPAAGTGTLYVGNQGTALITGPFAYGETIYVTITPYATVDGSQAKGVAAVVVKLIDGSSISTGYNNQGSMIPFTTPLPGSFFSTATGGIGAGQMWLSLGWTSQTAYRADQSSFTIPAPPAAPSAPTLSQVAGGALGARTRWARICYVKNDNGQLVLYPVSAESSLAISANFLLKVTSPADPGGGFYDGWAVLIGSASNAEYVQKLSPTIAFGTDFTEATTGFSLTQNSQWTTNWKSLTVVGQDPLIQFWFYPFYDLAKNAVRVIWSTSQSAQLAAIQNGDGMVTLTNWAQPAPTLTTPSSGGSASSQFGGGRFL